jgi:DNA-binding Xre family transcriptional regulator
MSKEQSMLGKRKTREEVAINIALPKPPMPYVPLVYHVYDPITNRIFTVAKDEIAEVLNSFTLDQISKISQSFASLKLDLRDIFALHPKIDIANGEIFKNIITIFARDPYWSNPIRSKLDLLHIKFVDLLPVLFHGQQDRPGDTLAEMLDYFIDAELWDIIKIHDSMRALDIEMRQIIDLVNSRNVPKSFCNLMQSLTIGGIEIERINSAMTNMGLNMDDIFRIAHNSFAPCDSFVCLIEKLSLIDQECQEGDVDYSWIFNYILMRFWGIRCVELLSIPQEFILPERVISNIFDDFHDYLLPAYIDRNIKRVNSEKINQVLEFLQGDVSALLSVCYTYSAPLVVLQKIYQMFNNFSAAQVRVFKEAIDYGFCLKDLAMMMHYIPSEEKKCGLELKIFLKDVMNLRPAENLAVIKYNMKELEVETDHLLSFMPKRGLLYREFLDIQGCFLIMPETLEALKEICKELDFSVSELMDIAKLDAFADRFNIFSGIVSTLLHFFFDSPAKLQHMNNICDALDIKFLDILSVLDTEFADAPIEGLIDILNAFNVTGNRSIADIYNIINELCVISGALARVRREGEIDHDSPQVAEILRQAQEVDSKISKQDVSVKYVMLVAFCSHHRWRNAYEDVSTLLISYYEARIDDDSELAQAISDTAEYAEESTLLGSDSSVDDLTVYNL